MLKKKPWVYRITKVDDTATRGLIVFTMKQDKFEPGHDYICMDPDSEDYGEMYADYYKYTVKPMHEDELKHIETEQTNVSGEVLKLSGSSSTIKIGGTGKVFTAKVLSPTNDETTKYHKEFVWTISLDDGKTQTEITNTDLITIYPEHSEKYPNKIKFKFNGDESYANQIIKLKCQTDNLIDELILGITVL